MDIRWHNLRPKEYASFPYLTKGPKEIHENPFKWYFNYRQGWHTVSEMGDRSSNLKHKSGITTHFHTMLPWSVKPVQYPIWFYLIPSWLTLSPWTSYTQCNRSFFKMKCGKIVSTLGSWGTPLIIFTWSFAGFWVGFFSWAVPKLFQDKDRLGKSVSGMEKQ